MKTTEHKINWSQGPTLIKINSELTNSGACFFQVRETDTKREQGLCCGSGS